MDILDNIVWLYNVGKGLKWFEQSSRDLEYRANKTDRSYCKTHRGSAENDAC